MQDLLNLIRWMLLGRFRSKASLEAEILALRHQLNVLRRTSPRRPVSVSEIRSGRNDGAIRREPAAKECCRSPGQTSSAVSGCRCNIVGTRPAHAADAA